MHTNYANSSSEHWPFKFKNKTGIWGSISTGGIQSAGAPGIPDPAEGTRTALRSSVRLTHCSTRLCSRSRSCSFLSAKENVHQIRNQSYFHWRKSSSKLYLIYWEGFGFADLGTVVGASTPHSISLEAYSDLHLDTNRAPFVIDSCKIKIGFSQTLTVYERECRSRYFSHLLMILPTAIFVIESQIIGSVPEFCTGLTEIWIRRCWPCLKW